MGVVVLSQEFFGAIKKDFIPKIFLQETVKYIMVLQKPSGDERDKPLPLNRVRGRTTEVCYR